jgi:hypothetical protein
VTGIRIGEVLVQQGALTETQVEHILAVQRATRRPFGDLAERLYGVNPRAVEDAWVSQYTRLTGITNLKNETPDADAIELLTHRQAWQFHVLPLGRHELELRMATSANQLVRAVNFASRTFKEPVFFQITQADQLREHLMQYYPVPSYIAEYAESM